MSHRLAIRSKKRVRRGYVFTAEIDAAQHKLLFTTRSLERMKRWDLNEEQVLEALLFPEEVLRGHRNRFIAHRRFGKHVVRAIYEYHEGVPCVVTVYFPYSVKYFRGGGSYEDKILS